MIPSSRHHTAHLHHVGLGVGELLDTGPGVAVVLDVRGRLGDVFHLNRTQSSSHYIYCILQISNIDKKDPLS